jgi:hypothetical protein
MSVVDKEIQMRSLVAQAYVLGVCFGTASAVALATDCWLDSAVRCCDATVEFQFRLATAPPDCPPVVYSSPWLPRAGRHENGYTAIQPTADACSFAYWSLVNGVCILSQPQITYCYGNRVADNSIPCNGGDANP